MKKIKIKPLMSKFKKAIKKRSAYPYIVILAILLVLPLLKFTPSHNESLSLRSAAPSMPTVTVNLPLDGVTYIILNTDDNSLAARGSGFSEKFTLPVGNYKIQFSEIYGYSTPQPQIFSLEPTSNIMVEGKYYPSRQIPLLGVKVFPDNAKYNIYSAPDKIIVSGTGSQFFQLPPGNYMIEFLDSGWYRSPGKQNFYVAERVVTTVTAVYSEKK